MASRKSKAKTNDNTRVVFAAIFGFLVALLVFYFASPSGKFTASGEVNPEFLTAVIKNPSFEEGTRYWVGTYHTVSSSWASDGRYSSTQIVDPDYPGYPETIWQAFVVPATASKVTVDANVVSLTSDYYSVRPPHVRVCELTTATGLVACETVYAKRTGTQTFTVDITKYRNIPVILEMTDAGHKTAYWDNVKVV